MHLFFGMLSQKYFVSRPFLLLMQFNLALLRFLVYPHHNFNQSLKLIYSINHSLLSLFHALLWLFDLASGLSSYLHFRNIVHNHFIHLFYGLRYTVSENKPPSNYYGWLLQALESPHSFHSITSSHVHSCHCVYHSSRLRVRLLLLLLLLYIVYYIYESFIHQIAGSTNNIREHTM